MNTIAKLVLLNMFPWGHGPVFALIFGASLIALLIKFVSRPGKLALSVLIWTGIFVAALCADWLVFDWELLIRAYARFMQVSRASDPDTATVMAAGFAQQAHRINCFSEGVGFLLGLLIAAVGIHGLARPALPHVQATKPTEAMAIESPELIGTPR